MITASIKDNPAGAGLIISVGLHIVLILLVMFGLPIFWQPEPLPEVIGIQLATLSDITAAPKAAKKSVDKIKAGADTAPVEQKQPPKPDTPPPTPVAKPAAAPPPPAPTPPQPESKPAEQPKPEQAEPIPDKNKPEQKKAEQPKPQPPKPEQKKPKPDEKPKKPDTTDADFAKLLPDILHQAPAPDTNAPKTKPSAPAPQQEASEAPDAPNISDIPLTQSETDGIKQQVEGNWNNSAWIGSPNAADLRISVRVHLLPDGTVTSIDVLTQQNDPYFAAFRDSVLRAVKMSSPLKIPTGKPQATAVLNFIPSDLN